MFRIRMLDLRPKGCRFASRPIAVMNNCVTKQYNLVPAKGWICCAACKVNVGVSSHCHRFHGTFTCEKVRSNDPLYFPFYVINN